MKKPYYAVIFTSLLSENIKGYNKMASKMEILAKQQPCFLGIESALDHLGITVSYWKTLDDINNWRSNLDHLAAQKLGKEQWYHWYKVRICKVEREYESS
ncbi:MAG: antibiotic biosynthesis monooxygenase [Flavobacteriaceae bacterium]